jgi:hypothetical protein
MINRLRIVALFSILIFNSTGTSGSDRNPLPSRGIVPDEVIAVKIAEVIFQPIFGAEEVAKYLPYHAKLKDDIWTVYGTLKPGSRGGTPQMTIQKKDGKVMEVWHSL